MKKSLFSIISVFLISGLVTFTGCKKEPIESTPPLLADPSVTEISVNSAVLMGMVLDEGSLAVTERGFCWSTEQEPLISDSKLAFGKGAGSYSGRITRLLLGTEYYVRTYASNLEGTSYSNAIMITTPATATTATVSTRVPEYITSVTVVAGGEVLNTGGGELAERGVCWSVVPSPTIESSRESAGTGSGRFTLLLTGLQPARTYYLRAYVISSAGISYGPEMSFKTLAIYGFKKADFPGESLNHSINFSIENIVYVGLGVSPALGFLPARDLWRWDQETNLWTRLADFPGTLNNPKGFSIGRRGYVLTSGGYDNEGNAVNEFWEFDPALNKWTRKSNLPSPVSRLSPVAFSIGSKGYIGLGLNPGGYLPVYNNDFWEWDQATDRWTRKSDFPGKGRTEAFAFALGTNGYIGTGNCSQAFFDPDSWDGDPMWLPPPSSTPAEGPDLADFWEYEQAADRWTRKSDFPGSARVNAVGFSISNKGYVGAGTYSFENDFWEWDQISDSWTKLGTVGESVLSLGGGSVGSGGYMLASPDAWSLHPIELWTFPLPTDD